MGIYASALDDEGSLQSEVFKQTKFMGWMDRKTNGQTNGQIGNYLLYPNKQSATYTLNLAMQVSMPVSFTQLFACQSHLEDV